MITERYFLISCVRPYNAQYYSTKYFSDAPHSIKNLMNWKLPSIGIWLRIFWQKCKDVSEKPARFFSAYIKVDDAGGRGFVSNVGKHAKLNDAMWISDVTNRYLFALSGSKVNQTSRYQLATVYIVTLRHTLLAFLY